MGNVTIKLLAQRLNLSTATVSKALRDSHEIGSFTKKRVMDLARELNYVPHPYAGSLRRRKSKTIAVVIPEVADSFFSLALNGIEEIAIEKGYHALIYLTHESVARERAILKDLESGRVDGVLISVTKQTDSAEHIKALNSDVPLVFFDRVCEDVDTAKITTNDFESAYLATKHLIDCGCKKITLMSISDSLSISSKRLEGYKKALLDHQIAYSPAQVIQYTEDATINYQIVVDTLTGVDRPDGIIATVEKMTTEIYKACQAHDIAIPKDLKVICFSNQPAAEILNPSLSTITQPAFEMGKQAARILFKALNNKFLRLNDESLVIPSELVVRGSTGK